MSANNPSKLHLYKLSELKKNQECEVVDFELHSQSIEDQFTIQKMKELGIVKGTKIIIQHHAPFGRDPIAANVRGSLIGLRKRDAAKIIVKHTNRTNS